jgi:DNA-binding GntR family transcriptional regulator
MQKALATIDRPNLSASVVSLVREMVVDGRLPAGERINEVHLSARLGISRTPLREALSRLAAEGALDIEPRSGFFVHPLTLEEFEQIYPIRALLDPEALRLAGLPDSERLARLEAQNRELGNTQDPEAVIALDDAWHLELLAGCPNRALVALIQQFMGRTRRYELALMREQRNVQRSFEDHVVILDALRKGRLANACKSLRQNMKSGSGPIVAWLRGRSEREG